MVDKYSVLETDFHFRFQLPITVHKLSTENLLLVFTEVFKLRAQWENIGLALEFNPGALDAMKGPYKDPKDSLKDMIKEWLKTFDDCCWERLVESLRHPIVGEVNFAKTLEEKYCTGGSEPSAGEISMLSVVASYFHTSCMQLGTFHC